MLIVSRKEKESVILDFNGEIVEITVAEIGHQVRLGFTAPACCKILRKELYATIAENKEAILDTESVGLRQRLLKIAVSGEPQG